MEFSLLLKTTHVLFFSINSNTVFLKSMMLLSPKYVGLDYQTLCSKWYANTL